MTTVQPPPICDYEGSDYRTRFWENQGRDYEDLAERTALRRLLVPRGQTLLDIGAGFGRLADEYAGYQRVVLFDFSRTLLREAQTRLRDDPRFLFVAGNWYQMPFVGGLFDSLVQVRTIHHAADIPQLFAELARIARPNGQYVLEFANKHNLKAIARYWLGRQKWSPFALEPVEFAELNFDFHPRWVRQQLAVFGFSPELMLAVSYFRLGLVKKAVPAAWLARLDAVLQPSGRLWQLSPSVFVASRASSANQSAPADAFFACPTCRTALSGPGAEDLICSNDACRCRWAVRDGLYDFKEAL
jgi:SAM-dependent methyltransferase